MSRTPDLSSVNRSKHLAWPQCVFQLDFSPCHLSKQAYYLCKLLCRVTGPLLSYFDSDGKPCTVPKFVKGISLRLINLI
jgi:hypothetical protein